MKKATETATQQRVVLVWKEKKLCSACGTLYGTLLDVFAYQEVAKQRRLLRHKRITLLVGPRKMILILIFENSSTRSFAEYG